MNIQKYDIWEPIELLPCKLYLEALHDDYEGFRILLKGEDKESSILKVAFETILTYRNIDESYYIKTLESVNSLGKWPLYIVHDSQYVNWFISENYYSFDPKTVLHYAFLTPNDCVDVLSFSKPLVKWI